MKWIKWTCTAAAVLVLLGRMVPARFEIDLTEGYSFRVQDGCLSVRMWPTPREQDLHHPIGPDTYTLPLWLPLVVLAVAAGILWRREAAVTCPAGST